MVVCEKRARGKRGTFPLMSIIYSRWNYCELCQFLYIKCLIYINTSLMGNVDDSTLQQEDEINLGSAIQETPLIWGYQYCEKSPLISLQGIVTRNIVICFLCL